MSGLNSSKAITHPSQQKGSVSGASGTADTAIEDEIVPEIAPLDAMAVRQFLGRLSDQQGQQSLPKSGLVVGGRVRR